jgi:alpha-tubulin suppressor-like RCC1 family protein
MYICMLINVCVCKCTYVCKCMCVLASTTMGQILTWGANDYGQLGMNISIYMICMYTCMYICMLINVCVCKCMCVLASTTMGQILTWGANDYGQLGMNISIHRCIHVCIYVCL